jgi:pimeloyl-ACP methyl ester carboxylesterase
VAVDADVRLEVLDWAGSGRPVILLAGGGNTAHVFDEFAPKLAAHGRVYGITRRGFGASGFATSERVLDRLRDDVLAVIDALGIQPPVLAGLSIAGAELSAVATSHPDRVAGLVYLDAGYPYAFEHDDGPTMQDFLRLQGPRRPTPGPSDVSSFSALQRSDEEANGFRTPEAELRQAWEATSDGRPAKPRESPGAPMFMAIMSGQSQRAAIRVPTLAIFAIPHAEENWIRESADPAVREAARAYFTGVDALAEKQAKAFAAVAPGARVVRLPGAHHIFLSNGPDVVREMDAFLAGRTLSPALSP